MELLTDYNLQLLYHPGKVNVIADALSHMVHHGISLMKVVKPDVARDLMRLRIELVLSNRIELYLSSVSTQPTLLDEIKYALLGEPEMEGIKVNIRKGKCLGSMRMVRE